MTNTMLLDAPADGGWATAVHPLAATTEADAVIAPLFDPAVEIMVATLFLVVVIGIHGICLGRISKFFSTRFALLTPRSSRWRATLLPAIAIALIVLLHLAETHIWAAALFAIGLVSTYGDSYFYVLEAYTTLGEGPNYMPIGFRLISPVIALTGLFTFGWSSSVLVYIVGQTGRLHAERIKASESQALNGTANADATG